MDVYDLLAIEILLLAGIASVLMILSIQIGKLRRLKMDAPREGMQILNIQNFGEEAIVDGKKIKDPIYRLLAIGNKRSDAIRPAKDFK